MFLKFRPVSLYENDNGPVPDIERHLEVTPRTMFCFTKLFLFLKDAFSNLYHFFLNISLKKYFKSYA